MNNFDEFAMSDALRNAVSEAIKEAGDFPRTSNKTDLTHYFMQIAFNIALETVHAYHEWLSPQLKS